MTAPYRFIPFLSILIFTEWSTLCISMSEWNWKTSSWNSDEINQESNVNVLTYVKEKRHQKVRWIKNIAEQVLKYNPKEKTKTWNYCTWPPEQLNNARQTNSKCIYFWNKRLQYHSLQEKISQYETTCLVYKRQSETGKRTNRIKKPKLGKNDSPQFSLSVPSKP